MAGGLGEFTELRLPRQPHVQRVLTGWEIGHVTNLDADSYAGNYRFPEMILAGRGVGCTAWAKWASTWASSLSVLANLPVALAKSRTCRGLTTASGILNAVRVPIQ